MVYNFLLEALKKPNPVICNPQFLTRILCHGAGLPFPKAETATKDALYGPSSPLNDISKYVAQVKAGKPGPIPPSPRPPPITAQSTPGSSSTRPGNEQEPPISPPPQPTPPPQEGQVAPLQENRKRQLEVLDLLDDISTKHQHLSPSRNLSIVDQRLTGILQATNTYLITSIEASMREKMEAELQTRSELAKTKLMEVELGKERLQSKLTTAEDNLRAS